MMSYQESAPSITSKSTRQSVYQTNGRPLSEEAIYKAKLKYGIYNNPAKVNLGVDPSAPDTAALLASSTDLSIHPYKRELSSEAATAALIAKTDSAPKAWKRNNFAPEAEYAAISAKSQKYPFYDQTSDNLDFDESNDAASSVLKQGSSSVARNALQDMYDFDDIRSGKATLSQFDNSSTSTKLSHPNDRRSGLPTSNNAYEASRRMNISAISKSASSGAAKTMSSRTDPERGFRSGLVTSNGYSTANGQVNISRITNSAEQNAARTMTLRTNPKSDFRSGLVTANAYNTANGQINIAKISNSAKESAAKSMTSRLARPNGNYGIPTASDNVNNEKFASVGALASLKYNVNPDLASKERATLAKNALVENKVLLKAIANANQTLDRIDSQISTENLFANREMNIKAIQIAQANLEKRRADNGKLDLGSGLKLDAEEINRMAQAIVQPVLADLNAKVALQKQNNLEREQQQNDLKQRRIQYFADKKAAKVALKQRREADKVSRRQKLQEDQDAIKQEQYEMCQDFDAQLQAKNDEFKEQVNKEEAAKQEIEDERTAKMKIITDTKAEKDVERKSEIDDIQNEKDEDVAPILAELEHESSILKDLITERKASETFHDEQKLRLATVKANYESTLAKLELISQHLEDAEGLLAKAASDEERETAEGKLIQAQNDLEQEQKEREHSEFLTNRDQLQSEIDDKEQERLKLVDELTEAKKAHLSEEREINQLLPSHLQKEFPDDISEEDAFDSSKFALDDATIQEPSEIESEPEDEPVTVPTLDHLDPKPVVIAPRSPEPAAKSVSKPVATSAPINISHSNDPLKSVPTNDKPPIANAASNKKTSLPGFLSRRKSASVKKSSASSRSAAVVGGATSVDVGTQPYSPTSPTSPTKKKGFGKKFIDFMTQEPPKKSKKKRSTTAGASKATESVASPVTSPVELTKSTASAAVTAPETKEVVPKTVVTTSKDEVVGEELKTTFSGFSQGSEVNEDVIEAKKD